MTSPTCGRSPRSLSTPITEITAPSTFCPISYAVKKACESPLRTITGTAAAFASMRLLTAFPCLALSVGAASVAQIYCIFEGDSSEALKICKELSSQTEKIKELQAKQQSLYRKNQEEGAAIEAQLKESLQRLVRLQEAVLAPLNDPGRLEKIASMKQEIDRLLASTKDSLEQARKSFEKITTLTPDLEELNQLVKDSPTSTSVQSLKVSSEALSKMQTLIPRLATAIEALNILDPIFRELECFNQQLQSNFIQITLLTSEVYDEKFRIISEQLDAQKRLTEASQARVVQLQISTAEGVIANQQTQELLTQHEGTIKQLRESILNIKVHAFLAGIFSVAAMSALYLSRNSLTLLLASVSLTLNATLVLNNLNALKELLQRIQFFCTAWRVYCLRLN